jgi:hypothetical protein
LDFNEILGDGKPFALSVIVFGALFLPFPLAAMGIVLNLYGIPPSMGYLIRWSIETSSCGQQTPAQTYYWIQKIFGVVGAVQSTVALITGFVSANAAYVYEVHLSLVSVHSAIMYLPMQVDAGKERAGLKDIMIKYRKAGIVVNIFNSLHSHVIFVIVLGCGLVLLVFNGYILIKQRDLFHPLILGCILWLVFFAYVCVWSLLVAAGKIHSSSESYIQSLSSNSNTLKSRVARRSVRSLQPMKIKVGSVNFVDRLSPLVLVLYCVEQTISLSLIG